MAHLVRRIAPALVATLVAVAAHAEAPAASSEPDCLAKPNGPSAQGSHWFYRVQRPSGRHCWYQRPIDAARNAPAQPQAPAETAAPPRAAAAPASAPVSEASAAPGGVTADSESVVPPVAAPVNEPPGWPAVAAIPAAPPAAAPVDRLPARSVEPAPPPAPEPKLDAPQLDAAPSKHLPARTPAVARGAEFAEPSTHVPALLGAVSALVIIIIGSFAGRILAQRPSRRPQVNARARDWQSPVASAEEESPGIVPVMPGGGDVAHARSGRDAEALASPDDWGLRPSRAPRRVAPQETHGAAPRETAPPSRESARVLEENVRDLLHRLQLDLHGQPMPAAAVAAPAHVLPTAPELDAVLAIWRAKRSG
jgi:hypothetical protein